METAVEIRYASHLLGRPDWLRFVICKELCHALASPIGAHDTANGTIVDLIARFSVLSHQQPLTGMSYAYSIEILAEVAALEILCPLARRKAIVAAEGQPDQARLGDLAIEFNLPLEQMTLAFVPGFMSALEDLMA
jgi:hypothetical protein